jgi:hypothetical protein
VIAAAAQGSGPDQYTMTSYYRDDLAALPEMGVVAGQLWRQAGTGPADVRTAVLYDHFTPYVLIQLEELGFCARGEAREFIAGGAIEMGGRLPLNPHGGQLGEAYIHGMNGIAEAVRQVRGTSVNQVPGDGPVLVTAGTGVPTSGLILSLPVRVLGGRAGRAREASRALMTGPFMGGFWSFRRGAILLGSEVGRIYSEVPVVRTRIVVRRFVTAIVLAVTVVAMALAVAGAATTHHSLADNGVISSRN